MKTILITGVAGLIGNHLARYLLDCGYKVIGIDNLSGGYKEFLPIHSNFHFYLNDAEDDIIEKVFETHRPQAVFHFAAYAAEGLSPFIRKFNYNNNVLASVNIVNLCVKYDAKLIFTSSMAVYGYQDTPFTEDMTPSPVDPYGIAKYTVEMDIKQAARQFGLDYTIVRPHNVIGIYQNIWDKYRNVLGIFCYNALHDKPLLVYGDGKQTRAFSDIKFCLPAFEKMIHRFGGATFNIGADRHCTVSELAEKVKAAAKKYDGRDVEILHVEERDEVKHAFSDHSLAKSVLGFEDKTNLDELVIRMFDWSSQQKDRPVNTMEYEIDKGIYSFWK